MGKPATVFGVVLLVCAPLVTWLSGLAPAGAPAQGADKKPAPADNSFCYVCHANYEEESLADTHRRAGVGCAKCHGTSKKHSGDEDNITPPDIMYPAAKIDPACGECHSEHDVPASKVIDRWLVVCKGKTNPKNVVCTDCHGEHRLTVRTRRWDKTTGKLIADDGVRMMELVPVRKPEEKPNEPLTGKDLPKPQQP